MEPIVKKFKLDIENFIHYKKDNVQYILYIKYDLYTYIKLFHTGTYLWLRDYRNILLKASYDIDNYYNISEIETPINTIDDIL